MEAMVDNKREREELAENSTDQIKGEPTAADLNCSSPAPKKNKSDFVQPPVPTKPKQCHFYVKRKRRYCHLTARNGVRFCGEHLNSLTPEELENSSNLDSKSGKNDYNASGKKRIPCPYDDKHTIFERDLEKHKLKCNARPPDVEAIYFSKDLHVAMIDEQEVSKLSDQPALDIENFLKVVEEKSKEIIPEIQDEILDHNALSAQKEKKSDLKHVTQQASLIGHLEKEGLMDPGNCFIEFGAGKGELSLYISQALETIASTSSENTESPIKELTPMILVDRKNFRYKFDRFLSKSSSPEFHRITIDIKDLDLTKMEYIKNRPVVAYSKHLCGAATDLTLRSLAHFHKSGGKIAGIVIALCCHHACSTRSYTSINYLLQHGVLTNPAQFPWLNSMGSWATCGQRHDDDSETSPIELKETGHFTGLPHQQREKLGYLAKRAIDSGRANFVRDALNLGVRLVRYVPQNLSLENVALIATSPKKNTL